MTTPSLNPHLQFFHRNRLRVAVVAAILNFSAVMKAELILYATDAATQQLFTLDPANAAASLVGDFGVVGLMGGLAYSAQDDVLFGSTVTTDTLYRIDRSTGVATGIGPLGVLLVQALAFDDTSGILYGAYGDQSLYRISTSTGAATLIGSIGLRISGLSFHPVSHLLYGSTTSSGGGVFTLDPASGQVIAQVSPRGFNGISFDPTTDTLYGVSNGGNVLTGGLDKGLYTINIQTGEVTLVGAISLNNPLDIQFISTSVVRPSLTLSTLSVSQVRISWATNSTGYALEYTAHLPATVWTPVTNEVATLSNQFFVTMETSFPTRFLRLRKP